MRVLVLGGYGLIGAHLVGRLLAGGHEVVGLGRRTGCAAQRWPDVRWISADLSTLLSPAAWAPVLTACRCEAIVNAAGVLQDGATDRVEDVQSKSMQALYAAAPAHGIERFVQISATRACPQASTAFMRSKGEADVALAASALEWVILRPGLVISPQAYGGTALLRALAAMPCVMPVALGDSLVQTVAADDVAEAVLWSVEGSAPSRRAYDLVEEVPHSVGEIQRRLRAWLGLPPAIEWKVPPAVVRCVAGLADGLGWLGWRSPIRSTAVFELAAGVRGDPEPWRAVGGPALKPIEGSLRSLPSTVQERWFARTFLLRPLAVAVLAVFWGVTGLLALASPDEARRVLTSRGIGEAFAHGAVVVGALVDIALGAAILAKPLVVHASRGMILLTLAYLAGGTLLAPDLWLDPLGPLLKAVPAVFPALLALALAGDR